MSLTTELSLSSTTPFASPKPLMTAVVERNLMACFLGWGFDLLSAPLEVEGGVRRDLTSAVRWARPRVLSLLTFKFGGVKRLERHRDLGRHVHFRQFDFDVFGSRHLSSSVHTLHALSSSFLMLGLARSAKLALGNVLVSLGLCEAWGVLNLPTKRRHAQSVLDKGLWLEASHLHSLLTLGRFDASGAFASGLGLGPKNASSVLSLAAPNATASASINSAFLVLEGSCAGEVGVRELLWVHAAMGAMGLLQHVVVKPLLSRGLAYYNGVVFEVVPLVAAAGERNVFVKVGSLAGGGRYDGFYLWPLCSSSCVGCSLGSTRLVDWKWSLRRRFPNPPRGVCVSWEPSLSFSSSLVRVINELEARSLKPLVAAACGLRLALKRSEGCRVLVYRLGGRWLIKNLVKRKLLCCRLATSKLWRSLLIDQVWANDDAAALAAAEVAGAES
ncbi:putative histidyl-tRNA synthetase [Candidatus Hodgkinia cicadicola Dsem]|nr:putative histidyl-tRNA synthetase [Candidatus Hodgkinia cicadicola Dsem]